MTHNQLRKMFLSFFENRGHKVIPSSKLFLEDDPTLLFVNAGMNVFKNIFMGNSQSPYPRVVNTQKCLRVNGKHNDLEDVGLDGYHHTFFEMLGSWSFSDYSKKEIIQWAWEFLTKELSLEKAKLWVTVFETDDEAFDLWKQNVELETGHLSREGRKYNFWSMGATGPCGPCSEIHYDLGEDACCRQGEDHHCTVNGDCGRYIEIWNIVFIMFERQENGEEHPLKNQYIDAGMGLERLARILQGKKSNYETDIFSPLLNAIGLLSKKDYENSKQEDQVAFRVIADHIRALCFCIADGVVPSNTGRGYVLRRILRRAYRYGKKLGMSEHFLSSLVSEVVQVMGDAFPELKEKQSQIESILRTEEDKFSQTLESGLSIFEKELAKISGKIVPGTLAFLMLDTYGFPIDLVMLLAKEKGYTVDMLAFDEELEKQRKLSWESKKFSLPKTTQDFTVLDPEITKTTFVGYEMLEASDSKIVKYQKVEGEILLVLDKTPFYAEGGGQVSDTGIIYSPNFVFYVKDVQKTPTEYIHYGELEGVFNEQDLVSTKVDKERRFSIKRHHTGVHVFHAILKKVLEEEIEFNSTYVSEDYFYCDLPYSNRLSKDQLRALEEEMNRVIEACIPVYTHLYASLEDADKKNPASRFKDRLLDKEVTRVVEVLGVTTDLCGGTHASNTGELGSFKILADVSAGSNLRHLECVCGMKAWEIFSQMYEESRDLSHELKCSVREVPQKARDLWNENRQFKKDIRKMQLELAQYRFHVDKVQKSGEIATAPFYTAVFQEAGMGDIKRLALEKLNNQDKGVALLFSETPSGTLYVLVSTQPEWNGVSLEALHQIVLKTLQAKGGGKATSFNGSFPTPLGEDLQKKLFDLLLV